ncbi:FeoA family protein [Cylindrospermopsis raciborskii]|uniref:Iron transporter FeoA n=1 Tax=Cylindrospermopsis raciborskii CS-505 TaxID=533240 RepID=A0A853MCQ6_9CYAN|nr:FeoA family protein [Cylindrospermopsis raciborskii]EFA68726.1 FeoA [Cylindrospermopsis raciborskii CS-505]OBU76639.1 iron transporter FeoA [Cylindrospermopsis raciborskii CS-505]
MFTPFTVVGCSLELLQTGEKGIVTVCQPQNEIIKKKLISMGIRTGTNIMVEQKLPVFIIKAANVSMTIDRETIGAIYVRVLQNFST